MRTRWPPLRADARRPQRIGDENRAARRRRFASLRATARRARHGRLLRRARSRSTSRAPPGARCSSGFSSTPTCWSRTSCPARWRCGGLVYEQMLATRGATGRGQRVEATLFDSGLALQMPHAFKLVLLGPCAAAHGQLAPQHRAVRPLHGSRHVGQCDLRHHRSTQFGRQALAYHWNAGAGGTSAAAALSPKWTSAAAARTARVGSSNRITPTAS